LKPKDLRQSKIENYGKFPLGVFRSHIYQEKYAQTGRSYWMHKKEEMKRKEKTHKSNQAQDLLWNKTVSKLEDDLRQLSLKTSGKKEDAFQYDRSRDC
jgi:hypothetical protein